ncbi:MAG: NAD(P)H-flavin oxidoreductase [Elusimicrobia bacterium]|nr:MAG: NAD(P)H-flavin oxidoreductase [Elusimicrobiota bacterium]KAF0156562.1 MAG: NAD(P)H-flavin oxidoreductase [Elusimicrobiota bacterium]
MSRAPILFLACLVLAGPAWAQKGGIKLPPPAVSGKTSAEEVIHKRRSVREFSDAPLTLAEAGQLLWAAQGVTEKTRGFRSAPSAGAIYPLRTYLAAERVSGLPRGIYLYSPSKHSLILVKAEGGAPLLEGVASQGFVAAAPLSVILAADHTAIKKRYKERAERYTNMEAGHAAQNFHLQAEALGLGSVAVGSFSDAALHRAAAMTAGEVPLYILPAGRKPR